DKEPLFDTLDTLAMVLPIVAGVVRTLTPNREAMAASLSQAMLATDLADYLVKRGVAFREAHHLVGQAVLRSEQRGIGLGQLTLEDFQDISSHFEADLYRVLSYEGSVEARDVIGGTALSAVQMQLEQAKETLTGQA
ncbi:MAG: argininosuccinate lyase, partial [Anaerolineae bacterium]|nr:argininosuccinate lyase [Anaerolineae bacterium]